MLKCYWSHINANISWDVKRAVLRVLKSLFCHNLLFWFCFASSAFHYFVLQVVKVHFFRVVGFNIIRKDSLNGPFHCCAFNEAVSPFFPPETKKKAHLLCTKEVDRLPGTLQCYKKTEFKNWIFFGKTFWSSSQLLFEWILSCLGSNGKHFCRLRWIKLMTKWEPLNVLFC